MKSLTEVLYKIIRPVKEKISTLVEDKTGKSIFLNVLNIFMAIIYTELNHSNHFITNRLI